MNYITEDEYKIRVNTVVKKLLEMDSVKLYPKSAFDDGVIATYHPTLDYRYTFMSYPNINHPDFKREVHYIVKYLMEAETKIL